jgi:dihydroflavonol-4-reductase
VNFVTGGTGLIGSHLLFKLANDGQNVRALYRSKQSLNDTQQIFNYYKKPELFEKIEWVDGDILDVNLTHEQIKGCSNVFHCAAIVSFNPNHKKKLFKVNIEGTANIVNACIENEVNKLCYVSSVTTLGTPNINGIIDEKSNWREKKKPSNYSISKYYAEQEVWRATQEGLKSIIVAPSMVIGAGNFDKGSLAVFKRIKQGLKYYTNGTTGVIDVRDVTDIMLSLMKKDVANEKFCLVSENISFKDYFEIIAKELNVEPPANLAGKTATKIAWITEKIKTMITGQEPVITKETAKIAHAKDVYSNEKIKSTLNYNFIPVRESIAQTASYYKSQK